MSIQLSEKNIHEMTENEYNVLCGIIGFEKIKNIAKKFKDNHSKSQVFKSNYGLKPINTNAGACQLFRVFFKNENWSKTDERKDAIDSFLDRLKKVLTTKWNLTITDQTDNSQLWVMIDKTQGKSEYEKALLRIAFGASIPKNVIETLRANYLKGEDPIIKNDSTKNKDTKNADAENPNLTKLKNDLEDIRNSYKELKDKFEDKNNDFNTANNEATKYKNLYNEEKKNSDSLRQQLSDKTQQLATLTENYNTLNDSLKDKSAQAQKDSDELKALKDKLESVLMTVPSSIDRIDETSIKDIVSKLNLILENKDFNSLKRYAIALYIVAGTNAQ